MTRTTALRTPTARPTVTWSARANATFGTPGSGRILRTTRATCCRSSSGCASAGVAVIPYGGGSSVVGGVEADVGDGYRGAVSLDMRNISGVLEVGSGVAVCEDRRGDVRAGVRGATASARADPASFPPVIRAVDPGRVDRHPCRWPLRDPAHPHRRLRRVRPSGHAARPARDAPAAGLRRRPRPGTAVPGLRGDPRGDHRGVDAPPAQAAPPGRCVGLFHELRGCRDGHARDRAIRAEPEQLPPARP